MYNSPHFDGKKFLNPVPTKVNSDNSFFKILKQFLQKHPGRIPSTPLGPFSVDQKKIDHINKDEIRVTWLGHSTLILAIDGKQIITDPVWYQRASPFKHIGPKRFFDPPLNMKELPFLDAVLLSHDHYDHLDKLAIKKLAYSNIPIICMLGVGKRLIKWGIDKNLITELDWWQQTEVLKDFSITALPSRHFSGRSLSDRFSTLWGSFAIKGTTHQVYFGADSGYYNGFKTIGDKLGPFDLTLLDTGAYNKMWEEIHMGPENAVQAHLDLKGKILMPIHWGTFALAFHPWKEPVERIIKAAAKYNVTLLLPEPGETITVNSEGYNSKWWEKYQ